MRTAIPAQGLVPSTLLPALAVSSALIGGWLIVHGFVRPALAGSFLALLALPILVRPRAGLVCTLAFLIFLGDFRRIVTVVASASAYDPILMVAPLAALLLLLQSSRQTPIRVDSSLSKWIIGLMALLVVQAANPIQGGPSVGLGGLLLYLPPLLWFWIGRAYGEEAFVERVLYRVLLPTSLVAVILGFYQLTIGFLPYEQDWINRFGYAALNVGGSTRPFAFFTAASEYMVFLGMSFVLVIAGRLQGRGVGLMAVPLLASLVFSGGRGTFVASLIAVAVLWALKGKSRRVWIPRLMVAFAIGALGTWWSLQQLETAQLSGAADHLVQRQADGLLNPLDPNHSTLLIHLDLIASGFQQGIANPLGHGTGVTTRAGDKLGGATINTELDVTNMFLSLGLAGGVLYCAIVFTTLRLAIRTWQSTRRLVPLCIVGVLIVGLGGWLAVGNYSIVAIIWFLIGSLDRIAREAEP